MTQLHYKGWTETTCPKDHKPLLKVIGDMEKVQQATGNNPIVVMCRWVQCVFHLRLWSVAFGAWHIVHWELALHANRTAHSYWFTSVLEGSFLCNQHIHCHYVSILLVYKMNYSGYLVTVALFPSDAVMEQVARERSYPSMPRLSV